MTISNITFSCKQYFFILFGMFNEPIVFCYILFQCWELNLSEPRSTSCRRRWSSCPPFTVHLGASSGRCSDRPWCSGARTSPKSRPVSSSWTWSSRARPRPRPPWHPQQYPADGGETQNSKLWTLIHIVLLTVINMLNHVRVFKDNKLINWKHCFFLGERILFYFMNK